MRITRLKNFIVQKLKAEIPDTLTYHSVHHTLEVLKVCNEYIKRLKISSGDAYLLRTAALFHDIGIMWDYFNHETLGMKFVRNTLPEWGYTIEEINKICGMILATKIPQSPASLPEQIICDADVDYLGTDRFYIVANTLFKEFLYYGLVHDDEGWDRVQVNFLNQHTYHTPYAKKFREPVKRKYLNEIMQKRNWDEKIFSPYHHLSKV